MPVDSSVARDLSVVAVMSALPAVALPSPPT